MRLAVAVALAAGCGSPPPAAGPSNVAAPARALVFRRLDTGLVMARSTLTTYTLRRDGERAVLEVAHQEASSGLPRKGGGPPAPWTPARTTTFTGTARQRGDVLALDLTAAGPASAGSDEVRAMALDCRWVDVAVAAASAVRVRSSQESECGDTGTWSPPARTTLRALGCQPRPTPAEVAEEPPPIPEDPDEARWQREQAAADALRAQLTFGDAPGIEYLWVNDDCVIQGGDLRQIPTDGSVGAVRGS